MSGSVLQFGLLAYGITWLLVLPLVLLGLGISSIELSPLWHGLGALGPLLAAYSMRRAANPSTRISDLFKQQEAWTQTRTVTWALVLSPIALAAVSLIGVRASGQATGLQGLVEAVASPAWLGSVAVGSVMYGLGEEPGWRGWLLPRLQERRGAILGTLILSLIWAGWHAPFFFYRFQFEGTGTIVGFFVGLLAGAFWLTFVFNSTGGSVWVVVVWHILWNAVSQAALVMSMPVVAVLNTLMFVLGFGVLVIWGRCDLTAYPMRNTP